MPATKELSVVDEHNLEKLAQAMGVREAPAHVVALYDRVRRMCDRIGAGGLTGQTLVLIAALATDESWVQEAPAPPVVPLPATGKGQ